MSTLQFAPWSSDIELSFYASLASQKINHDMLNDAPRNVVGSYEVRPTDIPERSGRLQVHSNAFNAQDPPSGQYRAEGIVRNTNTIEEYKSLDRTAIMTEAGRRIWDAINDGSVYENPSILSSFYAIFFADLKKYKYTFHFAFPALHSDPAWKIEGSSQMDPEDAASLFTAVQNWKINAEADVRQHGFFLAKKASSSSAPAQPSDSSESALPWTIGSLSDYHIAPFADSAQSADFYVCFADPSTYPQNPGWALRNLLALVKHRWNLSTVNIICFRDQTVPRSRSFNLVLNLSSPASQSIIAGSMPKVTQWERNPETGKLSSRSVDLSSTMDPLRLADASVDLNLKLMKWRIAPSLDLQAISSTSCLLLGAGTLGSYVARNLLGWGVRRITFVDNGRVSFSNPVRQPLFNYTDCLGGGKPKAETAAAALREIYPGVQSEGISMSVPMAGHPLVSEADEAKVKAEYERLEQLFDAHDAIFLLMDSRESRWLPTLMGKAKGKLVVNAALGFDSFVVMRHGVEAATTSTQEAAGDAAARTDELGCYFCNDVVAPADSLSDRTLDQQCTVTRPGIAAIASALLVELLVSVLQHPQRAGAPAPASRTASRDPPEHALGLVPHSLRGFLAAWETVVLRGPAYDCCSACGPAVVAAFRADGWAFVRRALNERGFVEEVSGLAEVQRRAEAAAKEIEALELSEEEDDGAFEGDGELL